MSKAWAARPPDLVAGIEARGFIPGPPSRSSLVPASCPSARPANCLDHGGGVYDLEYGTDQLEVHSDAVQRGQNVLIVDDVLATGGPPPLPSG